MVSSKRKIRFYPWGDWRENILSPGGPCGWLGSNSNSGYLKAAAHDVEQGNEVWLVAGKKISNGGSPRGSS